MRRQSEPIVEAVALNWKLCVAAGLSSTAVQVFSVGLNVPRLNPTFLVLSGPTAASVALIGPPVSVVKEWVVAFAGLRVPVKVSVIAVDVGVTGLILSLQPATARPAASRAAHAIRRNISSPEPNDRLLDLQWPALV